MGLDGRENTQRRRRTSAQTEVNGCEHAPGQGEEPGHRGGRCWHLREGKPVLTAEPLRCALHRLLASILGSHRGQYCIKDVRPESANSSPWTRMAAAVTGHWTAAPAPAAVRGDAGKRRDTEGLTRQGQRAGPLLAHHGVQPPAPPAVGLIAGSQRAVCPVTWPHTPTLSFSPAERLTKQDFGGARKRGCK